MLFRKREEAERTTIEHHLYEDAIGEEFEFDLEDPFTGDVSEGQGKAVVTIRESTKLCGRLVDGPAADYFALRLPLLSL